MPEGLAGRLAGLDPGEAVDLAYRTALARPAGPDEAERGVAFLEHQRQLYAADGKTDPGRLALVDYCQSLMSLNEFLYLR